MTRLELAYADPKALQRLAKWLRVDPALPHLELVDAVYFRAAAGRAFHAFQKG